MIEPFLFVCLEYGVLFYCVGLFLKGYEDESELEKLRI